MTPRIDPKQPVPLKPLGGPADQVHVFEPEAVQAVNAALAAERPLLVRGEPGIGKSQLARAVAVCLERAFIPFVVDSRTESRDLLWSFDAVERLATAQVIGAVGRKSEAEVRDDLRLERFLRPGPLWWAFQWQSAHDVAEPVGAEPPPNPDGFPFERGCVVLIDEIDKAESDVPNGLLEALGAGSFRPLGRSEPVTARGGIPPLVIITTNEERALPDAFIRRCLVLHLRLPEARQELIDTLVDRGAAHFGERADPRVLQAAAEMLYADRRDAEDRSIRPLPGQAEFLDLVRATINLVPGDPDEQMRVLDVVRAFTLKKQAGAA